MLELAVATPETTLFGTELHDTLNTKAAAMMHEVIKLHPFVDGNKRTAFLAVDTFLRLNGYELKTSKQEAVEISLEASRCSIGVAGIADWIRTCIKRRPKVRPLRCFF